LLNQVVTHTHIIADPVDIRASGDFHGDDYIADGDADRAGDLCGRRDCAGNGAT
jgi:hypothetical protein